MKSIAYLKSGITAFTLATFCTAVFAAGPTFKEAVADYSAGKYKEALVKFSELSKTNGKNATLHYYSAMCYQNLGQLSEARTEYQFVATNGDPTLKGYAARALASLGKKGAPTATAVPWVNGMGTISAVSPNMSGMNVAAPPQGQAARLH